MTPWPSGLVPMLATPGELPTGEGWSFEIKWDGVRALVFSQPDGLQMQSRNQLEITARYPELWPLATQLGRPAVLDGEVVAFDEGGRPSFGQLQQRMHVADEREVRRRMASTPVALFLFDLLWLDGTTLLDRTYDERRSVLEGLGLAGPNWQVPARHDDGVVLAEAARVQGLEGVVAKRRASKYEPGRRSRSWLKVKHVRTQEIVVGGWIPGEGRRDGRFGALLGGVHEGDRLVYVGRVGTGFSERLLGELSAELATLARPTSPFDPVPKLPGAHWVEPVIVAEVGFTEWTTNGTLRHPSYRGRRFDKAPHDVVREH